MACKYKKVLENFSNNKNIIILKQHKDRGVVTRIVKITLKSVVKSLENYNLENLKQIH